MQCGAVLYGKGRRLFFNMGVLMIKSQLERCGVDDMKKVWFLAVGVIVAIYLIGVAFFAGKYAFGTSVNGIPVAYKTPTEVSLDLMQRTRTRRFQFKLQDGVVVDASFDMLGIYCPAEADVSQQTLPSPFLWPVSLVSRTSYVLDSHMACNESKLYKGLFELKFVQDGTEPPVDAYITQDANGSFVIVPDKVGTEIDVDILAEGVKKAVDDASFTVDLNKLDCYKRADIRSDNQKLVSYINAANDFRNMVILLDFGKDCVMQIPSDVLDACRVMKNSRAEVNIDAVTDYVAKLAEKYDTYGTVRKFHTSTDEIVDVKNAGFGVCDFAGWEMNQAECVTLLGNALAAGKDTTVTVPWNKTGVTHDEMNDFGDTYLEISLANQKMWLYVDGECVCETDVVTGLANTSKATPPGIYRTTDFYREMTMRGSYGTAFCHYFVRITLDGVGMHDASWRSKYGGDIYLTNGSHGCVNTPYDAAKFIFETLNKRDTYTPIIVW